ncbi:MAG: hypothetical protein KAS32_00820 [Candidatus Peribacteraceae bacterium]|nr:hypothetical protein [Candidatus Peribacteraceae bacterium]
MRLKRHINEAKKRTVYHGDDYNTTKINPKMMGGGNSQVGVGIYFGTEKIANFYGKNIVSIDIDPKDFRDGMADIDTMLNTSTAVKIITYLHKKDPDFWYIFSDYVGVASPEEVENYHFEELWDMMKVTEARNFQIELMQASNAKVFVEAWNKYTKIHGLYEKSTDFWSVINTKYKVTKVSP